MCPLVRVRRLRDLSSSTRSRGRRLMDRSSRPRLSALSSDLESSTSPLPMPLRTTTDGWHAGALPSSWACSRRTSEPSISSVSYRICGASTSIWTSTSESTLAIINSGEPSASTRHCILSSFRRGRASPNTSPTPTSRLYVSSPRTSILADCGFLAWSSTTPRCS